LISWTDIQTLTNAVTSYTVKFQKKVGGTYFSIPGVCDDRTYAQCSLVGGCSCTIPMTTLTSATGWTASDTDKINVEITNTNSDGSTTATIDVNDLATKSIDYYFVP
jgi:hypothetical protein